MIRWLRRLFALFAVLAASAARAEGPVLMVEDPSILSALEQRADSFCREDYMCQAFPPDTPGPAKVKGIGFCSPTYFIFQMRIDNHTTPW